MRGVHHLVPSKSISSIWSVMYFPKPSFSLATLGFGCVVRSIVVVGFYGSMESFNPTAAEKARTKDAFSGADHNNMRPTHQRGLEGGDEGHGG